MTHSYLKSASLCEYVGTHKFSCVDDRQLSVKFGWTGECHGGEFDDPDGLL